jgi:hypothetical protein
MIRVVVLATVYNGAVNKWKAVFQDRTQQATTEQLAMPGDSVVQKGQKLFLNVDCHLKDHKAVVVG